MEYSNKTFFFLMFVVFFTFLLDVDGENDVTNVNKTDGNESDANNTIYVDNVHNATYNGKICRPTMISSLIWEPTIFCWSTCIGSCLSIYSTEDWLCVKSTNFAGMLAKCMCCNYELKTTSSKNV